MTNNGNLTLKDVVLKDVLTRADGTTVLPDGWESDGQKSVKWHREQPEYLSTATK